MKRTILTTLATMAMAFGVLAQGAFDVNNVQCAGGIVVNGTSGSSISGFNYLNGTGGFEVWYLNNAAFNMSLINQFNTGGGNPSSAYNALSANGFTKATSFSGVAISGGGFAKGQLNMAGAAVGQVTVAIAAWQGAGTSFGSGFSGVLALNVTNIDSTITPALTPLNLNNGSPASGSGGGFNTQDLILNNVAATPEPSTFALAGLGAAALLIFRRRR